LTLYEIFCRLVIVFWDIGHYDFSKKQKNKGECQMKKSGKLSNYRFKKYDFKSECYIFQSSQQERLVIPFNLYWRGRNRLDVTKIRNAIILLLEGKTIFLTVNEMKKIHKISEYSEIKDVYIYDQKYRFIKDYPINRV
jgi:hypothetical protein